MENPTRGKLWLWGAAALFTAAATVLWACAPVMKEDVAFREMLRYFNGGSDTLSFNALWDYILCQRVVDNGRLANIISPLVTIADLPLLRGVIAGASLSATFLFLTLLARGERRPAAADALLFAAAAAGGFFLLPFRDNMVVFDYALNYILSSALCFGFCLGACRALTRPRKRVETIVVCLAGLLAAANHDGFALPMLGTFGCYVLFWKRLKLPAACWAMGASLLAGALVPVTAPAEWNRAAESVGGEALADSLATMAKFAPAVFLPLLLAPLPVYRALKARKLKAKGATAKTETGGDGAGWPGATILALRWVLGLVLFLPFGLEARQGWLPGCAAMGLLMTALRPVLARMPDRLNLSAAALLTAAACGLTLYMAKWQRIVERSDAAVLAALAASRDGTAFVDRVSADDLPKLSLARLANGQDNLSISYGPLNLNAPRGKVLAVVPAAVREYSAAEAVSVPGSCGIKEFRGHLLLDSVPPVFSRGLSAGGYAEAWLTIDYRFASGLATRERHRAFRFALPDGSPMVYIIADGLRFRTAGNGAIVSADLAGAEPFKHQTGGM